MNKNILILGADGMVGKVVFEYLHTAYPDNVWGTSRKKKKGKNVFTFTVETYQRDFSAIEKKIKVDYIINCIGILFNDSPLAELISVNSLFPHQLEKWCEEHKSKLIHISTDAVFSQLSGEVSESSLIGPTDNYGCSKLLGETTSSKTLTIRSSFIGLDPVTNRGLLEQIKKSKTFDGYTNQVWTGCTTLQFATFCEEIIKQNHFSKLRKASPIFHFAPLGPISKYEIAKTFATLLDKPPTITKTKGEKRNRVLKTNYVYLLFPNKYNNDIKKALQELINFKQ